MNWEFRLCGRAKANVLQLCRLVGGIAALLVLLKRWLVCSFVCLFNVCTVVHRVTANLFISLVFCQIHPYLAVYLQYMLKLYIFSQLAHRLKRNTYHSTLVRSYRLEQPLRSGDKQDATAKLPPFFSSPDGSRKPEATCLPSGRDLSG